ncbi:MAG: DNA-binding protein [Acidimicrobiales bacterium]|nr:DNA-binding protein [Acidimicrobiales bacterium]
MSDEAPPFRLLPRVDDTNEFFWTSGADGRLRFLRCQTCGYYIHPPSPICPIDLSRDLAPEAVSGRGTVHTFTINQQPWIPGYDPPYAIAIVELEEQEGLRLMTNIVGCGPDDVHVGMPVEVTFEHNNDVWLPLFRPGST